MGSTSICSDPPLEGVTSTCSDPPHEGVPSICSDPPLEGVTSTCSDPGGGPLYLLSPSPGDVILLMKHRPMFLTKLCVFAPF